MAKAPKADEISIKQIDDRWRIEKGPIRKKSIATERLLNDPIHRRYYRVGGKDSFGITIEIGKEFSYLDRKSDYVWYIYELCAVESVVNGVPTTTDRYLYRSYAATRQEAETAVARLKA